MTRYELAIAVADHIDAHPESYNFWNGVSNSDPMQAQCLLAHMAREAGLPQVWAEAFSPRVLGMSAGTFYGLMAYETSPFFTDMPSVATAGLRIVAEKYLKEPTPA